MKCYLCEEMAKWLVTIERLPGDPPRVGEVPVGRKSHTALCVEHGKPVGAATLLIAQ